MKASARAIKLIREFEGFASEPYYDDEDGWTGGIGHLFKPGEEVRSCTEEEAEVWLCADLAEAEAIINRFVLVPLSQNQFDALCSFVYNVGPGSASKDGFVRLKSGRSSTMLRCLNAGDYAAAADEFPKWCYDDGRPLRGLKRRRLAEQLLFRSS